MESYRSADVGLVAFLNGIALNALRLPAVSLAFAEARLSTVTQSLTINAE